ncbi:MAG: type II toxin-antitoxin system VapC family toxin [Sporichthyaceae bacterium]
MERRVTLLLDSHVLHWWSAEPKRLSARATAEVSAADELAVSGITWWELAWLAANERIVLSVPVEVWLAGLAEQVRTIGITPSAARTAVDLPATFPGDPADRLIYATAVDRGWSLVTKDRRMRNHKHPTPVTVW